MEPEGRTSVIFVQHALERVSAWAEASQQQARRNALVASTVLARVRAERAAAEEAIARAVQRSLPAVRHRGDGSAEQPDGVVPAPRTPADEDISIQA